MHTSPVVPRSITIRRVHPEHVAGPDSMIVEMFLDPWGHTEFGLTPEQAAALVRQIGLFIEYETSASEPDEAR